MSKVDVGWAGHGNKVNCSVSFGTLVGAGDGEGVFVAVEDGVAVVRSAIGGPGGAEPVEEHAAAIAQPSTAATHRARLMSASSLLRKIIAALRC
jgi:hypothetical protein